MQVCCEQSLQRPSYCIHAREWQTELIPFHIRVFQGDPLSVVIFSMIINVYVELISYYMYTTKPTYRSLTYQFFYLNDDFMLAQFADDICMTTNSASYCQFLADISIPLFVELCLISDNPADLGPTYVFDPKLPMGSQHVPFNLVERVTSR